MNKNELKKLALLGLTSGLILNGTAIAADKNSKELLTDDDVAYYSTLGSQKLTEQDLLKQLNDNGKKMYNSLDAEGKKLALETASQNCSGNNKCQGLNACKTKDNACAGQGKCKGQSKCAIKDKNIAVKLVYDKMTSKRAKAAK